MTKEPILKKTLTELDEYFIYKCKKGLKERGLSDKPEYIERLNYEMETIIKMGFPGYFLVVYDIINYARSNNIQVGPGRGSVVGSLVAYSLKISNLDPIKYGLIFERFLNPERVSMPDVDMDFEKEKRDQVIQYVMDKYGHDKVAHIGTFGVLRAKNAVRSVARVLGADYQTGDALSKLLLNPVHGKPQPLATSFEKIEELAIDYKAVGLKGDILRNAEKVENLNSSVGVHASGIVIANQPLVELVPLFKGKGDEITTQWEMKNIEQIGLIKFDFLGLNALTKIHKATDLIRLTEPEFDLDTIPIDDKLTFDKLCSGEVQGVFQLEDSSGIRDLLMQIIPRNLEDICAILSIYRPGPLGHAYKDIYLQVRQGLRDPEYLVPELAPILGKTSGWMIYQEQILDIARHLCGYTYGQADNLRKAIGKKELKTMQAEEGRFKEGWVKHGLPEEVVGGLWDGIVKFADYSFNKSHAIAYALITYQTAYLKAHYPVEFMCAILSSESNADSIIKYISECKRLNINILPPDINKSGKQFEIDEDRNIRFGLAPIKNLGESAVEVILEERKLRKFNDLYDFCDRVDLGIINSKKLESLILSGAFDNTEYNRATLLSAVELLWDYRKDLKAYESKLDTYVKKVEAYEQRLEDIKLLADTPAKKPKPFKEPIKPDRPLIPIITCIKEMETNDLLAAEHELLGYYVSDHPLSKYADTIVIQRLNTISMAKQLRDKAPVEIAAVITNKNEITNKKKQKQAFLIIEDTTGQMEATIFAGIYSKFSELLAKNIPLKFSGMIELNEVAKNSYNSEDIETDTEKVAKIIVRSVEPLKELHLSRQGEIDIEVPLVDLAKVTSLLTKYNKGKNKLVLSVRSGDGTVFKFPAISIDISEKQIYTELESLHVAVI